MKTTFADRLLDFHRLLSPDWKLPKGVELLFPFGSSETWGVMTTFFKKYYDDNQSRSIIFGINPGRFGAGITGTPFTDPKLLEEKCGIKNDFHKRNELSALFVYDYIEAFGTIEQFYQHFYITSLCPLGFVKDSKNYNYYDSKVLEKAVEPYIIQNIQQLLKDGCSSKAAICMGQGKNYAYFKQLNEQHQFFEEVIPLPHPRWVMQYRRKRKEEFVEQYREVLERIASSTN
ncbi:MAG: uracil-DNA glycosylase family protein [Bacteroidota bacterium]